VLGDAGPGVHFDGGLELSGIHPACCSDHVEHRRDCDGLGARDGLVDVEVGLEAVARGHDDCAEHEVAALHEVGGSSGCADRECFEQLERRVAMVRTQAQQHLSSLSDRGRRPGSLA
jgi:hypothetical protein